MFVILNVAIVYQMDIKKIKVIIELFLSLEEVQRLAKGLSGLGISKIRLTGGEPTVRKDFFDIVKILKQNSGIKKTVITTNGYKLDQLAEQIIESGLDGINISIDSLDKNKFHQITGHDRLDEILRGIEKLQKLNFKNIKIKPSFEVLIWLNVFILSEFVPN